jgi:UDP-2,4-diacetamido-2,4,6-trideoxy-beta-L-altropyranose hydrolase
MNKSDLAIITPSVISHEAMFLGLPFIAIKTADNQEIMYQYLRQINSPVLKLNDLKKIPEMIRKYDQKD